MYVHGMGPACHGGSRRLKRSSCKNNLQEQACICGALLTVPYHHDWCRLNLQAKPGCKRGWCVKGMTGVATISGVNYCGFGLQGALCIGVATRLNYAHAVPFLFTMPLALSDWRPCRVVDMIGPCPVVRTLIRPLPPEGGCSGVITVNLLGQPKTH